MPLLAASRWGLASRLRRGTDPSLMCRWGLSCAGLASCVRGASISLMTSPHNLPVNRSGLKSVYGCPQVPDCNGEALPGPVAASLHPAEAGLGHGARPEDVELLPAAQQQQPPLQQPVLQQANGGVGAHQGGGSGGNAEIVEALAPSHRQELGEHQQSQPASDPGLRLNFHRSTPPHAVWIVTMHSSAAWPSQTLLCFSPQAACVNL